jgi:hypothetical protein
MPLKGVFDAAALTGGGVEVRLALRVPPGEGFGIAGEVGSQRFGIIGLNEPKTGSRSVHVTWTSRMGADRQRSVRQTGWSRSIRLLCGASADLR